MMRFHKLKVKAGSINCVFASGYCTVTAYNNIICGSVVLEYQVGRFSFSLS